jgi:expansin (peptidoglycan-binding protein)
VASPRGLFNVTVEDRCEGCQDSDLDFTEQVFATRIADIGVGRIQITWSFCDGRDFV